MEAELGKTISKFAISLLQEMISDTENVFFSPASIAIALSMVLAGAAGRTREQLLEVLKCGKNEATTHKAFARMVKVINTPTQSCQFYIANRMYSMRNFGVIRQFTKTLAGSYRSDFKQVNFTDPAVCGEINKWVADVTNQRIKDIIPPGVLSFDTRLVIVNALYFKGNWFEPFGEYATHDEDFYISASEKIQTKMMNNTFDMCLYADDETYQAILLAYLEPSLGMAVILPKEKDGLSRVLQQLNAEMFLNLKSTMKCKKVEVSLPKFKIETSCNLSAQLEKLGMKDMFSGIEANFTRITKDSRGLFVSNVIHKAFVEVTEKGTEAAASSAIIIIDECGTEVMMKPIIFKADHPFIFSILDHRFNCPLFCGTLIRPQGF